MATPTRGQPMAHLMPRFTEELRKKLIALKSQRTAWEKEEEEKEQARVDEVWKFGFYCKGNI